MKRRYGVVALALVVGLSTISPALGGPSPVATVAGGVKGLAEKALGQSKKAKKKARKAKRQAKQAKRRAKRAKLLAEQNAELIAQSQGTPGPQGPKGDAGPEGPKGDPGEDATNLFAYVRDTASDTGSTDEATIAYGEGVTAVEDPDNAFTYTLSFDRSLEGCVVQANTGTGRPRGTASSYLKTVAHVTLEDAGIAPNQARVNFYKPDSSSSYDTSFMVTAFC